jgi:hypothetical protein
VGIVTSGRRQELVAWRPEYDHGCVELTRHEFYERCFYAINEESTVAQTTLLVELYWNATEDEDRWKLFETTCYACRTTARAITIIALKGWVREKQ